MTKKENSVIMPKIFTHSERERIEETLLSVAGDCLSLYGVRKTTVDEIVKRAHIAKGSFYLFYDSKEDLFLSLFDSFVSSLENEYLDMLQELDENHIVTSLSLVFSRIAKLFYKKGIYRFLDEENMALIKRKTDSKKYSLFQENGERIFKMIFSYFSIDESDDTRKFMKAYKSVLSLYLLEGVEESQETIDLLIRGLVLQLVE